MPNVNADFIPFIEKGLQQYADEVEAKLREIKVSMSGNLLVECRFVTWYNKCS